MTLLQIRPATPDDAPAIAEIYNQGIALRSSTFETDLRSPEERRQWILSHSPRHPVLVAEGERGVVAWASVSAYRSRPCYDGVGEFSIYVHQDARGQGVGRQLLTAMIAEAAALGYWKLISRVFVHNLASRHLCQACGFREVGVYEKHAKLDGRWIDCVIVERLIEENLT